MNEAQRQFYLKQCGITLWYARSPLPGAAASRDFEFALPEEAARPEKSAPAHDSVYARPSEALKENSGAPDAVSPSVARQVTAAPATPQIDKKPAITRGSAVPEPASQLPVEEKATLAVDLRIVATRHGLIVAQLGDQAGIELQEKLLVAISRAVDADSPPQSLQAVTWPVFSNPAVPGNGDAGLRAVLASLLDRHSGRPWLGLGPDADQLFALVAGGQGTGSHEGAQPREIFPHHLGALAASGQLKRQLWELISQRFIGKTPTVH